MDEDDITPLEELIDDLKDIDGFPKGDNEDILELSDPPYYTACPNPYIEDFIEEHGTEYDSEGDEYEKKPFVSDVKAGKHHPIYTAHTYHTKVPHQAVKEFIEHYTEPGDLVFDGFCGTGMSGVAASLTDRYSIMSELSPAATFIAYNLLNPISSEEFEQEFEEIVKEVKDECGWMYKTKHTKEAINTRSKEHPSILNDEEDIYGSINYVVWNDVFECPYCKNEICFGETPEGKKPGEMQDDYNCPYCDAKIEKKEAERVFEEKYDEFIGKKIQIVKEKPILISYSIENKNFWKKPDEYDKEIVKKVENSEIPYWVPNYRMPKGDESRRNDKFGLTHVHHFYTKRNLWTILKFRDLCFKRDVRYWFFINSLLQKSSKLMALNSDYIGRVTKGTLYVSPIRQEANIFHFIDKNISHFKKSLSELNNLKRGSIVSTQSTTDLENIPSNSIDYIFTDPPFGDNLMYSELNYIWESFLKIFTKKNKESIKNKTQNKTLTDYTKLMTQCFKEMYRILKPNRWITIEFHNSKASVWNSIQESINRAGFIIAQVSVLDKKIGSFKQITSAGAVKNDLVINAYKPKKEFSDKLIEKAGKGMEVEFIKQQLGHLPIKPNVERTEKMLYSKMLAHYVENGFKVQYDSTEFYDLLKENFVEIDGYWFLDTQVDEYNEWKGQLSLEELEKEFDKQQKLLVTDEKSALNWLNNFLKEPKEYSEIYTKFQQVLTQSEDEIPELKDLLDNNFVIEDKKYRRPKTEKEKKQVQKSREKELDREFEKIVREAREGRTKIKNVRKEALIHGFTKWYQEEKYDEILEVADSLYKSTLESSGDIMDFVDIAEMKTSNKKKIEDY